MRLPEGNAAFIFCLYKFFINFALCNGVLLDQFPVRSSKEN